MLRLLPPGSGHIVGIGAELSFSGPARVVSSSFRLSGQKLNSEEGSKAPPLKAFYQNSVSCRVSHTEARHWQLTGGAAT